MSSDGEEAWANVAFAVVIASAFCFFIFTVRGCVNESEARSEQFKTEAIKGGYQQDRDGNWYRDDRKEVKP